MVQWTKKLPLDKRVWLGVIILFVVFIVSAILQIYYIKTAAVILLVLHFLFFRDPRRESPINVGVLSPADGVVSLIDSVYEDKFLNEEAVRIRIFLSVFNVHVTRSPLAGIVKYQKFFKGKFLNALRKDAAQHNQSNWIGIENRSRKLIVRQITGAIARRIYSDVSISQVVGRGEKIGMICYGSTAEVFIPKRLFRPTTKVGDKVKAGLTVIGSWLDEEA